MAAVVRSSKSSRANARLELVDSGVWAASALYLRCGACRAEGEVPNPERKSLMMLVIQAELELNWYIPMGGGPVLCPSCHRREAQRVGAETFLAAPSQTHVVGHDGRVRLYPTQASQ